MLQVLTKVLNGLVTTIQTIKQIMHEIADQLPEQASFDDAMRILYVRQKLDRGSRRNGTAIPP